jgi:hypothetical protein
VAYAPALPMYGFADIGDPWNALGMRGSGPSAQYDSGIPGLERSAGPGMFDSHAKPWSPENPIFWAGVVLAAAIGLLGFATELRVGPARAGVKVGD